MAKRAAKPKVPTLNERLLEAKHIGLIFNVDIQAYHVYVYTPEEQARNVSGREQQLKETKERSTARATLLNFYTVLAVGNDWIELQAATPDNEHLLVASRFIYKVTLPAKVTPVSKE